MWHHEEALFETIDVPLSHDLQHRPKKRKRLVASQTQEETWEIDKDFLEKKSHAEQAGKTFR